MSLPYVAGGVAEIIGWVAHSATAAEHLEGVISPLPGTTPGRGKTWPWFSSVYPREHEANACYEAQRRAARARVRGEKAEFYHWAKVAAEIARISPQVEMDIEMVTAIVAEEERRSG